MPAPASPSTGKTWIDTYGDYTLLNATTGAKAYLYFTPCGWFGAGRYQVRQLGLPAPPCPGLACQTGCRWAAPCARLPQAAQPAHAS